MAPLLEVDSVTTGYGRVEVLHQLSFRVPAGCVVALLGPNGAGKTTTLRTLSGTLPVWRGAIRLAGQRIDGRSAYAVARRGLVLVDGVDGEIVAHFVEDNPEDWSSLKA